MDKGFISHNELIEVYVWGQVRVYVDRQLFSIGPADSPNVLNALRAKVDFNKIVIARKGKRRIYFLESQRGKLAAEMLPRIYSSVV